MTIPAWPTINTHLTLYHGCVESAAKKIETAVGVRVGRPNVDFGNGFYTTTIWDQAVAWAGKVYEKKYPPRLFRNGNPADPPAVVKFVIPLAELARMNSFVFVRGAATNVQFWSLIRHCRAGNSHAHPVRIPPEDWYDMVVGPVASWPPKAGLPLYCYGLHNGTDWEAFDQFSFHTPTAVEMLNKLNRSNPAEFEIVSIPL
jgi:Protein of unknown function (DUF3990)